MFLIVVFGSAICYFFVWSLGGIAFLYTFRGLVSFGNFVHITTVPFETMCVGGIGVGIFVGMAALPFIRKCAEDRSVTV